MAYTSLELAKVAAISADAKKAFDIEVLDLTGISDVCDYFVILSASNSRQADMLVDEIEEKVFKNCSVKPFSIEGRAGLSWVLMDYGSVVVHVFLPESREFYRLERLWGEAPRVELAFEGADGQETL